MIKGEGVFGLWIDPDSEYDVWMHALEKFQGHLRDRWKSLLSHERLKNNLQFTVTFTTKNKINSMYEAAAFL